MHRILALLTLTTACLAAPPPPPGAFRNTPDAGRSQIANPLSRSANRPQAVNTTLGYEAVEQKHRFRRIDGKEVDLRPLFSWINRGKGARAGAAFNAECPLRDWRPLSGTIVSVLDDAVLVSLPLSDRAVFIKNFPRDLNPAKGADVSVVAVEAGTYDYQADAGRKEAVRVYDYGVPFTPAVLPGMNLEPKAGVSTNLPSAKSPPLKLR